MQKNFYDIGKNGTYDDICKHYGPDSEKDILKGLEDREDNKDRKDLFIDLYNKYNTIFYNTCLLGIRCFVDYVLEDTPANYKLNWGLKNACEGGHRDIVDLLIKKGANDWNWGFMGACISGHLDLVKYMVEKGANEYHSGFNITLRYKHWPIVEYLLMIGSTSVVPKKYTDYYQYLAYKLNKSKPSIHGLYNVLDELVLLY